jgi:hydroxyethylthiazole kinase-like uncharacterized protein yjeF
MTTSIKDLYQTAQVRELDRVAIHDFKIAGFTLMQRAGKAVLKALNTNWPKAKKIIIVCGKGNNAGDGYVVARLAKKAKLTITVLYLAAPEKLTGDALLAYKACKASKVNIKEFNENELKHAGIIIDAIFGSGLQGEVTGETAKAIQAINNSKLPVLAIDIPSGLDADTGNPLGVAVKVDVTVTFVAPKQGMFTGLARDYCGKIIYDDLNIPPKVFAKIQCHTELLDLNRLLHYLPQRNRSSYKNEFGHVLIVGGDLGMAGAVQMAGRAAVRIGAGLAAVITQPEHVAAINNVCPELMCYGMSDFSGKLTEIINRATVVVIGPGLGSSAWSKALWQIAKEASKPLVIDADGLNLLAENPAKSENWILTPHPGEAARLLDCTPRDIQKDRFAAIRALQKRYGGVIVLKGAGTLVIGSNQKIGVCAAGNPGMASGGMGDVLSGVIGGLLAQGLSLEKAACLGVMLHSTAADLAAEEYGERGLLATDLLPYLRSLVNRR